MGFDRRELLLPENNLKDPKINLCCCQVINKNERCFLTKLRTCKEFFEQSGPPLRLPPPQPPLVVVPLPRESGDSNMKELATAGMTILACVIVGALLLGIIFALVRAYYMKRNSSRRRDPPLFFGTQEDFLDELNGPEVDHPIWYINTVGLPQSVIDCISVFKYKKDEGLIEGTECSVCLSEFQEDESLRLLPKCSHAFHVPCVDTWLRSHKNCPLCRAPIVTGAVVAQASELELSSSTVDSRNENMAENLENYSGEVSSRVREGGTSEVRNGLDTNGASPVEDVSTAENSNKLLPRWKTRNGDFDSRVLSDLTDNRRIVEEDIQQVRRSVSLDFSSASVIYKAVAGVVVDDKHQGSLDTRLVHPKKLKSISKRSSGSSSISKLIKSSSIGPSLQKGSISMKRSSSSSGKFSSFGHSRRHSILPL